MDGWQMTPSEGHVHKIERKLTLLARGLATGGLAGCLLFRSALYFQRRIRNESEGSRGGEDSRDDARALLRATLIVDRRERDNDGQAR